MNLAKVTPNTIFGVIFKHFSSLNDGFHPFFRVESYESFKPIQFREHNSRFYFGSFIVWVVVLDFIINLISQMRVDRNFLVVSTRIWPMTNEQRIVITIGGIIIAFSYFYRLPFESWKHTQPWFMYSIKPNEKEGKVFNEKLEFVHRKLARMLIKRQDELMSWMDWLTLIIIIDVQFVFTVPLYVGEFFLPDSNSGSWLTIFYLMIAPFFSIYCGYAVSYSNFLWLNTKYLQTKQEYYMDRVHDLMRRNFWTGYNGTRFILPCYFVEVRRILGLMREIRDYSQFWKPFVTFSFLSYILEFVYKSYSFVTTPTWEERVQISPVMSFALFYLVYLYYITVNCSRIVSNNVKLHSSLRFFQRRCKNVPINAHLKMDNIEGFQRLFQQTAFRLQNNWMINTRLFELLLNWICIACIKTFGPELKAELERYFNES